MRISWDFNEFYEFADRLNDLSKFEQFVKQATVEITKALHEMLFELTPVKTGNLCAAWGGGENYAYSIQEVSGGYSVTLINRGANDDGFMYGLAVNDGHWSYNQFGGPYGWVMGRFFVENSIDLTEPKIEPLMMKALQKWWESV